MDAGTEASVFGALSRPVAFVVLILAFLVGAWVGRGSVLLETRARRRHLDSEDGRHLEPVPRVFVGGAPRRISPSDPSL